MIIPLIIFGSLFLLIISVAFISINLLIDFVFSKDKHGDETWDYYSHPLSEEEFEDI